MKLEGTHVMVDLETLGTDYNAVIIALGAAQFTVNGISSTFYRRIDAQSCVAAGLTIDVSTVEWWMQQSDAARQIFTQKGDKLAHVLQDFSNWFPKEACLWGNGATFDNVILNSAYKAVSLQKPWPYWGDQCYRTIKAHHKHVPADAFNGVKHNALDDAIHQARHLIKIAAA
jgi:hypothetical protein